MTRALLLLCLGFLACTAEAPPPATHDAGPADYQLAVEGSARPVDMVWIPEGKFWIGRTEVPWALYLAWCDFQGTPDEAHGTTRPSKPLDTHPYDRGFGTKDRPALGMSHQAAKDFCAWLSQKTGHEYRLPTAEEWRTALGDKLPEDLGTVAWTADDNGGKPGLLAAKKPTAHGVHDLLGSVWEYLRDPRDPDSDWPIPVLLGGSYAEPLADLDPQRELLFNEDWTLADPNYPPGRWWVPDGGHLGFRLLRPGP